MKPKYNNLKYAYSMKGFKRAEATKEIIRYLAAGRIKTIEAI